MIRKITLIIFVMGVSSLCLAQGRFNREDAFNSPSAHAWNLFLIVNHPAKDPKTGRGLPDMTKKIGEPGTTVVWETWRLSETEVFLEKGARPPEWDDLTLPGGPVSGKVPEPSKAEFLMALKRNPKARTSQAATAIIKSMPKPFFEPNEGVFQGDGGFGESRMNRATYDFIRSNGLYSLEGQQRYAVEFVSGRKPAISFPVESMEVKAAWIEFTPEDLLSGKDKRFYIADYKGKRYGLAALHIITKDIPNWFWTTFHHKEAPIPDVQFGHGIGNGDAVGQPLVLKGTVWENYELGGTQTEYVDSIGQPTLLSDALIEKGFVRSSCISCHARATFSASSAVPALGSRPVTGIPNFSDYLKSGKPALLQADFLFSLPFRAKSER